MIKQKFNQGWVFQVGDGGALSALLGGQGPVPKNVTLPHDAEIEMPRSADEPAANGNGFFHADNYVYTKKYTPEDADKSYVLEFEAVYQNAFVYVNGVFVQKHPYGYGNFYADITNFLKFGEENEIKVVVRNHMPSGRWYTGGGIYRDVNLMVADRLHIAPDGVRLATTDLDEEYATIRVDTDLEYKGLGVRNIGLTIQLFDAEGAEVAADTMQVTMIEGKAASYRQWITVEKPHTWDAEDPYLYTYKATLKDGDEVVDEECGIFGIRTIKVDAKRGLRINGKVVKLAGGCVHHDCGITGAADYAHAQETRVRNLKKAGFNALRSSHYPMSRRMIEACDRLGMYIMDEFADVWTSTKVEGDYGMQMSDWWQYDIDNIVRKDYNHPSVILYSIGNEIPEVGNPLSTQWGKLLSDRLRQKDDTRFTVNSMNTMLAVMDRMPQIIAEIMAAQGVDISAMQQQGEGEAAPMEINSMMSNLQDVMSLVGNGEASGKATTEASGQVDISGFNYSALRYEPDHEKFPNRVVMGSETYPGDLDVNWALVQKLPYVIGDFDWTGYDYLGEAGIGNVSYGDDAPGFYAPFPMKSAYCGDLDLLGDPQPVAYWREIVWGKRTAPYIAVQHPEHFGQKVNMSQWRMTDGIRSWNFDGYEGKPVKIEVYADADEVELFVNGASVGTAAVGTRKAFIADFETTYAAGKVEAVAKKNGAEVGRDVLETADAASVIAAAADVDCIPADGTDIGYVEICMLDAAGRLNPACDAAVTVTVTGAGELAGFGSASPCSEENYYDTTARAFGGRLCAAVRGTGEAGTITVTLSAEGFADKVVTLEAK